MSMHRRRAKQSHFSYFAALILLAQLLLASVHVHLTSPHGIQVTAVASHDTSRTPADPVHQDKGLCPLCLAQTAAAGLLTPPTIELRIPANFAAIRFVPVFHRLAGRTAPNAFRPRAPPKSPLRLAA